MEIPGMQFFFKIVLRSTMCLSLLPFYMVFHKA